MIRSEVVNPASMKYFNPYETTKIPFPFGRLDEHGVPVTDLRRIGITISKREVYHPTPIIQYGLANYNKFIDTQEERYLKGFISCADYLRNTILADASIPYRGISIPFAHKALKLKTNWVSGMTQGQALSLLIRASSYESSGTKLDAAITKCFKSLSLPIEEGGVALFEEKYYFIEEAGNLKILNGFLYALIGLIEYRNYRVADAQAEELITKASNFLLAKLPDYDLGWWSKYALGIPFSVADRYYHMVHLKQLSWLYQEAEFKFVKQFIDKWDAYQDHFPFFRYHAYRILSRVLLKLNSVLH